MVQKSTTILTLFLMFLTLQSTGATVFEGRRLEAQCCKTCVENNVESTSFTPTFTKNLLLQMIQSNIPEKLIAGRLRNTPTTYLQSIADVMEDLKWRQ